MWSPLPHKQSMTPHSPNTHTRAQEQGVAVRATLHHLPFRILTTAQAPASPFPPSSPSPWLSSYLPSPNFLLRSNSCPRLPTSAFTHPPQCSIPPPL